jgi:hypothetical protein
MPVGELLHSSQRVATHRFATCSRCRHFADSDLSTRRRFFHRMSERPPYTSKFPVLEAPNVTPRAFQGTWEERVNEWGGFMKQA